MRKAIRDRLTQETSIKQWFQPYTADASTSKPFGVIKLPDDTPDPMHEQAFRRRVEIWVYHDLDTESALSVDASIDEVIQALAGQTLKTTSGRSFRLEFRGTVRDFDDDVLRAHAGRVDFDVPLVY
jgi:hypothetical protein